MKKLKVILMIAVAAFALQACNSGEKDSTEAADSANMEKDTSVVGAGIAVVEDDAKFVVDAANGGMTEVELSKLAQQKGSNAKAKGFANMMVLDHDMANAELKAIAKTKNVTLPDSLNTDSKKAWENLSKKSGVDFDKAYISAMVDDHKKTVSLFEDASKNLKDPDLRAFVDKTLPVIKGHLSKATTIKDGMK